MSKIYSDAFGSAYAQSFERLYRPFQQPPSTPSQQQPISLAKKKRNRKTRQQYKKKKAQAQHVTMQVQEVDHMQEVEHLKAQISAEKASKHVVLQSWNWVATSPQHAVISCVGMALFDGMIMVQDGAICMPPMGVG